MLNGAFCTAPSQLIGHRRRALRKRPMALPNLVHRDELFPRPVYARAFETLLAVSGDRQACKFAVELLALANDRHCEALLAEALDETVYAGQLPDLAFVAVAATPTLQVAA
jgi:hypothetical protein